MLKSLLPSSNDGELQPAGGCVVVKGQLSPGHSTAHTYNFLHYMKLYDRWDDIVADLSSENPDFLDIRRLWKGEQKRKTKKVQGTYLSSSGVTVLYDYFSLQPKSGVISN